MAGVSLGGPGESDDADWGATMNPESPPETAGGGEPVEEGRWDPFSLWGLRDTLLQPLADGTPGDDAEKRSLREHVAALQQEVAALRACRPATSTTVASDTVEPASNTVEPEEVSGVGLEDTRMCARASMCCERRER